MKKIVLLVVVASAIMGMLAISGCGKEKVYTVTFDANGGTGEMKEQIFVKDVAQALISNAFVRELYSFAGWNTVPDGSGVAYSEAQEITLEQDITLYAQWEQSAFRITFDANGGTGSMAPMAIDRGEAKYLPENTFTRSGYCFIGWATTASGEVVYSDKGRIMEIDSDLTLYAQWIKPEGGKQAVDLGLPSGLKWASCNVGANTPEEYGDYFAWGETEPKETYNWSTYRYYDGSNVTKYTGSDNLTILEASDDAAIANWGGAWRMPTEIEMKELRDNCTVAWATYNGVNGRVFVGPNGKSIFLPAAGYRYDSSLYYAGSYGLYWSSSLGSSNTYYAWNLYFNSGGCSMYYDYRYYGRSVRAVCQSQN